MITDPGAFIAKLEDAGEAEVRMRLANAAYGEPGSSRYNFVAHWLDEKDRARGEVIATEQSAAAARSAEAAERSAAAAEQSAAAAERQARTAKHALWTAIAAVLISIIALGVSIYENRSEPVGGGTTPAQTTPRR